MNTPYGPPDSGHPPQWDAQHRGQQPQGGQVPSAGAMPPYPGYGQQPPAGYGQPGYSPPPTQQSGQQPAGHPLPSQPASGQFSQQQFGGFPQPNPYTVDQSRGGRKKSSLVWIISGGLALVVAVAAVLAFVWPGWFTSKVFDNGAVADGVKTVLTRNYKQENVTDVSCPSNQKVKVGSSFTCTVTVDGQPKTVRITVKSNSGDYEVAQPK